MTTIKAIVNTSPTNAAIVDVPYPEPRNGHIIVKPTAWALNPDDVYHLDLDGDESCAGCLVGSDYAGVVVDVGPGVTKDFKRGDRVAGWAHGQNTLRQSDGAFAEFIEVKGYVQMKIPNNLSDVDAATQGIAISTMGLSFYRQLKLPLPGETVTKPFVVFIYGGSTAMGIAGIQFAKLSGGAVITTASPSNFDYVKSFGADHVLDYKSPTLIDDVRALAGGPLNYAFDTYPTDASAAICAAVLNSEGGARYVSLIPGTEKVVKARNPAVEAVFVLAYSSLGVSFLYERKFYDVVPEDFEFQKRFLGISEELFALGKLRAPRVFLNRGGAGLEGVLHGLEEVRANRVSGGKLVYTAVAHST